MQIICPGCGNYTVFTPDLEMCSNCGRRFKNARGIFDFVDSSDRSDERSFYDKAYTASKKDVTTKQTVDSVWPLWESPDAPENKIVFNRLGNLKGKTVLLLGNGESVKELFFVKMSPEHLIYSDLSTHALENIRERFDLDQYHQNLSFAAIDAHTIPFPDESFDVIYGFAMVHHLPDLDLFFASVIKALKPGGFTIFMDDAYAPLWHHSKQTWLKSFMHMSHKKTGISPEDYRFSMSGGFKENDLADKIRSAGGRPWFCRTSLLTYLYYRGVRKLMPVKLSTVFYSRSLSNAIRSLDTILCRIPLLNKNQIRLIWGFSKSQG
ncbi:MAG: methyltransferase domain-containing protein [Desulfobacula sp.]|nr:methyltransferase domain-containing protein [Desulfobacula sp.]